MEYLGNFSRNARIVTNSFLVLCIFFVRGVTSDACTYHRNGITSYVYCEHGCCGTETSRTCCSYKVSTSVLVVACVVSGLVVVALIASVIVCCYKNYKDKQQTRVRALRVEQARNAPIRAAEPPKPPAYTAAPPEYSETMPVSHYRPVTRQDNTSYNTRFGGMHGSQTSRTTQRNTIGRAPVYMSRTSGQYQPTSVETVPGSIDDLPPRYSSLDRGMTPATINAITANHRQRRSVRTPQPEVRNNTTIEEEASLASRADTESTLTRDTSTVAESRTQTRSASRIPQRVQPNGRQSSAISAASRNAIGRSANVGDHRNTTVSEIEDLEIEDLAEI